MQRQKARWPWEEDGDYHLQQTCRQVGESELFIIINKKCQSHLMRRRCWFIGIFSSEISSTARLPRLSSPAMKDDWIYEREKENRYRISAGGEEQRNSCE